MTFGELERRLLALLSQRVRRGEISQRRLARLAGVTQPHMHNVLKGLRRLRPEVADALLRGLELSIGDLLEEVSPAAAFRRIPLWRGPIGPHCRFPERAESVAGLLFPAAYLSCFTRPILLRLDIDEDAMWPLLEPGDLVLLDRAEEVRRKPVFESIYALSLGPRSAVCRCQRVGASLVLVPENSRRASRLPERVPLDKIDILLVVKGRVVWSCREFSGVL